MKYKCVPVSKDSKLYKFYSAEAIQKLIDSKSSETLKKINSTEQNKDEPMSGSQPSSKVDSKDSKAKTAKYEESESRIKDDESGSHSPSSKEVGKEELNNTNSHEEEEDMKVRLNLLDVREGKKEEEQKKARHENGTSKSELSSTAASVGESKDAKDAKVVKDGKENTSSSEETTKTTFTNKASQEDTLNTTKQKISLDKKEEEKVPSDKTVDNKATSDVIKSKMNKKDEKEKVENKKEEHITEDNINKVFEDLPEDDDVKSPPTTNSSEVMPLKGIFDNSFLWNSTTVDDEAGNVIADKNSTREKEMNALSEELVSDEDSAAATLSSSAAQNAESSNGDDYIEHLKDSSPLINDPFEFSDTDSVSRKKSVKDKPKKIVKDEPKKKNGKHEENLKSIHQNDKKEELKIKKKTHSAEGDHTLHAYLNQLDILMDKIVKPQPIVKQQNKASMTGVSMKKVNKVKSQAPKEYKLNKVPQYISDARTSIREKSINQSLLAMKKEISKKSPGANSFEGKSPTETNTNAKDKLDNSTTNSKQKLDDSTTNSKQKLDNKTTNSKEKLDNSTANSKKIVVVNEDIDGDENVSSMIESSIRKNGIRNIEGILSTFYSSLVAYKKKTGIKDIDITKFKPHIQKALKAELEKEREKKRALLKLLKKGYFNSSTSHVRANDQENAHVRNKTQLPASFTNNTGLLDTTSSRRINAAAVYLRNNTFEAYKGYEKRPSLLQASLRSGVRSTRNHTNAHSDPLIVGDVDLIANDKDAMENKVELHEESANIFDSDDPPQKPHINITLTHNDTFYHDNTAANAEKDNLKDFGITNLNIFHTYKSVKKDSLVNHKIDQSTAALLNEVDREIVKYFSGVATASKRDLFESLERAQKRNLNNSGVAGKEETKRRQYILDVLKDLKLLTREYDGAVRLRNKTMASISLKKLMSELEGLHNNSNYVFPDSDNYINNAVQEDIKENSEIAEGLSRDIVHNTTAGSDGNNTNKNMESKIIAAGNNETINQIKTHRKNNTAKLMEMHQAHSHLKELLLRELRNLNNNSYLEAAANDSAFSDEDDGAGFGSESDNIGQNETSHVFVSSHVASTKATKSYKEKDNSTSAITHITKNETTKDSLLQKQIKKSTKKFSKFHSFSVAHSDLTKIVNSLTTIHNKTNYALPPLSTEEDVDLVFGAGDGNQANRDDIEEISYDIKVTNTSSTKNNNGTKEGNSSVQVNSKSNPELNIKEEKNFNDTDTKTRNEGNNGDNYNKTKIKIDELMEKHFNGSHFDMNLNGDKNGNHTGKLVLNSDFKGDIHHNYINKTSLKFYSNGDKEDDNNMKKSESNFEASYIFDKQDGEFKSNNETLNDSKKASSTSYNGDNQNNGDNNHKEHNGTIQDRNNSNSSLNLNKNQLNITDQKLEYNRENQHNGDNQHKADSGTSQDNSNSISSSNLDKNQLNNTDQKLDYNGDNQHNGGDNNQHKHEIMDLLFTGNKSINIPTNDSENQMVVNHINREIENKTNTEQNFHKGDNLLAEDTELGSKTHDNNTLLNEEKENSKRLRKTKMKEENSHKNITKKLNETSPPPPPKTRGKTKEQLPSHTPLAPNETSYSFDIVNYIESDLNEYFNKSQLLNHAYPELVELLQEDDNNTTNTSLNRSDNNMMSDSEMDINIDHMIQEINSNNNTSPGNMINVSSFTHGNLHQVQENGILKKRQPPPMIRKKIDCIDGEGGLGIVDLFDGRPKCNATNSNPAGASYRYSREGVETASRRSFKQQQQQQQQGQTNIKKSIFTRYVNPLFHFTKNKKSYTPKPQTQTYYQTVPKDKKTMHEFALSFGDENDLIL